jgi:hypothetical protein
MHGDRLLRRQEYERMYKAFLRRARGVPIRNFKNRAVDLGSDDYLDASRVREWFERFETWEENQDGIEIRLINGRAVDDAVARSLRRWGGEQKKVSLSVVDRFCVEFDLALWEVEEYARISSNERHEAAPTPRNIAA